MISLLLLFLLHDPITNEYNNIVIEKQKTEWEKFFDFIYSKKIRWYCRGCMWEKWRYDCSSFISLYMIEKWIIKRRINSYILAWYGVRIQKTDLRKWDLVIILHLSWNHTMYFNRFDEYWRVVITDTYINKTSFSDRLIPNIWVWQHVYYIGNPVVYWMKKSFLTHYRKLVWPNFFTK